MTKADGLYIEVILCCLLVLGKLLQTELQDYHKNFEAKLFSLVLGSTCLFCASDILWILFQFLFPSVTAANYLINCVYYVASAFIGFTWFLFCQYNMGIQISQKKLMMFFALIPFLALVILSVTTPFTHLIFYIDSNNEYHRGKFHFLQVACLNCYFILTCVQALVNLFDKNNLASHKKCSSIVFFILWACIAQTVQSLVPGYPTIEIGLTMALLSVFIELKNSKITIDSLTQTNNKRQLIKFLTDKFNNPYDSEKPEKLYLLLIDIDFFNELNGVFGHIEGDQALILVADSLKKISSGHPYFLCRYGGDKFIIVCEKKSDDEVIKLCNDIKNLVSRDSKLSLKDYELSVSVDFEKRDSEKITTTDFMKKVKEFTYNKKRARIKD